MCDLSLRSAKCDIAAGNRDSLSGHTSPRQTVTSDILLYCGVAERTWNGAPISPGGYACISPVSGRTARTKKENWVYVPPETEVIQDSGAFSDNWTERLTFAAALDRQIRHGDKHGYAGQITHRATYDLLIDEVWSEGNRHKRRWSVSDAESAVDETVEAAVWLDKHRDGVPLVISAQGVDAAQYLRCMQRLMPLIQDNDIIGLGGWCIIGKMSRQMMPVFQETVTTVIPFLAGEGIKRVHIWGVIYPPALAALYYACSQHQIAVSTDSMGPCLNPTTGDWGYGNWRDNRYVRPDRENMGRERVRHATLTRLWLERFSTSSEYLSRFPAATSHFADRHGHTLLQENVTRPCAICGEEITTKRHHAKTCSARCRKALSRNLP